MTPSHKHRVIFLSPWFHGHMLYNLPSSHWWILRALSKAPGSISLSSLSLADRRDCVARGKWSLVRNPDRSWSHRCTSILWPQPMALWTEEMHKLRNVLNCLFRPAANELLRMLCGTLEGDRQVLCSHIAFFNVFIRRKHKMVTVHRTAPELLPQPLMIT